MEIIIIVCVIRNTSDQRKDTPITPCITPPLCLSLSFIHPSLSQHRAVCHRFSPSIPSGAFFVPVSPLVPVCLPRGVQNISFFHCPSPLLCVSVFLPLCLGVLQLCHLCVLVPTDFEKTTRLTVNQTNSNTKILYFALMNPLFPNQESLSSSVK